MHTLPDLPPMPPGTLENFASTSPRPGARHATGRYHGRDVDITVRHDRVREGSHLVVVVHEDAPGAFDRRIEYLVDDVDLDEGVDMGVALARALVDGRLH